MPDLILAIDQGTTNTKALLVDRVGQPIFRASASVQLLTPRADFVEQDPLALWQSVLEVAEACVQHAGSGSIRGIAISNQRETGVAWSRQNGNPIANAISWQCRRSADVCSEISSHAPLIRQTTGLPLDPLVTASKWGWLFENSLEVKNAAQNGDLCLGTVDSWLIYKLTGSKIHATDLSNASRTALLNLKTCAWDNALLDLFGIPHSALPKLNSSIGKFGICSTISGLEGIPIVAAIGDSHAALAGHGSDCSGTVKATYGTGSSLMMLASSLPEDTANLARTIAWSHAGIPHYALEGNITMTGSAVQWLGELLGLENPTSDVAALAASVSDSAGVFFVPAMVGLGAPHWDSTARGTITGLGRSSTKAHLARAAIEAIAFQIADVFHAMQKSSGSSIPALYADGGATRNDALMQFQADLLQLPVHRSACEDLSALGAAWLGGISLGWWKDLSVPAAEQQNSHTFTPQQSREKEYAAWKLAVSRARLKDGVHES